MTSPSGAGTPASLAIEDAAVDRPIAAPAAETSFTAEVVAVGVATALGAIVRLVPLAAAGFPLNDGGLFVTMARDIAAAGAPLPATTSYNGLEIPFAYPPLALDLTAAATRITGIDAVSLALVLPVIASLLTIPLVYLLGRALLPSRFHAFIAATLFAFVPRSFEWLIMGGGLTRAPGFLLALLTLVLLVTAIRRGSLAIGVGAGIALGLTALTHPQALVFAALSTLLLAAFLVRSRRGWIVVGIAIVTGVAIASTWLLPILAVHGPTPLVSAGSSGFSPIESLIYLTSFSLTDEVLWRPLMLLGIVGFLFELSRRRWLLPAWISVLIVIDPRSAATFSMIPLSLLGAVGLVDVLIARLFPGSLPIDPRSVWPASVVHRRSFEALFFVVILLGMVSGLFASVSPAYMTPLPAEAREAMRWVRDGTPSGVRVLVVSGRSWYEDATAEWFPTLTDRVSVATAQGHEWLGHDAWTAQVAGAEDLRLCAVRTVSCLDDWMEAHESADYVFIPKGPVESPIGADDCCIPLRETIRSAPGYVIVYDGPGATIAKVGAGARQGPGRAASISRR